jgi:hypothetical protein
MVLEILANPIPHPKAQSLLVLDGVSGLDTTSNKKQ